MEKGKKAVKYLRECREILASCCSKQIKAQAALNQYLLATQERDKLSQKEEKEIEAEIEKFKTTLDSFIKGTDELEIRWLRGVQGRVDRGRQARVDFDSGISSIGSAMMQPEEKGSGRSSLIAQATKEPDSKPSSSSFDISLTLPRIEITDTTKDSCDDSKTAQGAASSTVRSLERLPSEHAELADASTDSLSKDILQASNSQTESVTIPNEAAMRDPSRTEQLADDEAACSGQTTGAVCSGEGQDNQPVRASTVFAANLGEDKQFLQTQGNHQRKRHQKSTDRSSSF